MKTDTNQNFSIIITARSLGTISVCLWCSNVNYEHRKSRFKRKLKTKALF